MCAWRVKPKGKDECIQAIGIATLRYGYKFKFRFYDPYGGDGDVPDEHNGEKGQLCFHGAPVGSVLAIMRDGFRPSRNATGDAKLLSKFGVLPPLVWFSRTAPKEVCGKRLLECTTIGSPRLL